MGWSETGGGIPRELRVYERADADWHRAHSYVIDEAEAGYTCIVHLDSSGAVNVLTADADENLIVLTNRSAPDGIDQNCDGIDGVDADGDGRASVATGGDDPFDVPAG